MPQRMQRIYRVGEDGKYRAGRDRVEQITDVIITWGLVHPKQAVGIAASLCHLQRSLEIQKRRALGEEDREGRHGRIRHGIDHIITRALIWKPLND